MGRHFAVRGAIVVVAVSLGAAACGGDDGPAGTTTDDDLSAEGTGFDACPEAPTPVPVALETGIVFEHPDAGAAHVSCDEGYDRAPPSSGPHFGAWQNCGFYTAPVRDYTAVHALEHGAVWIAYHPDLDASQLAEIEARVDDDTHLLAAPYPGLGNPVVLTAWLRQLAVDEWSDPAVAEFLDDFTGRRSSTAPEAGASCTDAVGRPPDAPDADLAAIFDQLS